MRQPLPFLILTLLLASCTTSPTGQQQLLLFSEEDMAKLGDESFEEIKAQKSFCPRGRSPPMCVCVTAPLTAQVGGDWEVRVFQSDDVNAFALPGRHIGIYTGLLGVAQDADALAAVIGHEIAHVLARHGNARVSTQMATQAGLEVLSAVSGMESRAGAMISSRPWALGPRWASFCPFLASRKAKRTSWAYALWPTRASTPWAPFAFGKPWAANGERTAPARAALHPPGVLHAPRCPAPGLTGSGSPLRSQAQAAGRSPVCRLL